MTAPKLKISSIMRCDFSRVFLSEKFYVPLTRASLTKDVLVRRGDKASKAATCNEPTAIKGSK